METRALFDAAGFIATPNVSFTTVGDTKVINVAAGQEIQLTISLVEGEVNDSGGLLLTFTLDTTNTSAELDITNWSIANGFVDTAEGIDRGNGDHIVAGFAPVFPIAAPGSAVTLGTFTFNAPTEFGTYNFTLNASQTAFLTSIGNSQITSFAQVTINVLSTDFGDAPEEGEMNYPTLAASGGAAHITGIETFFLGQRLDTEDDGLPDADALGDDLNNAFNDEDGVDFLTQLIPGQSTSVKVVATLGAMASARLDAWVDFNADGDWQDDGEQIFDNQLLAAGDNNLQFDVPVDAVPGATFARFRMSSAGNLNPGGITPDGEVEDYKVTIEQVGAQQTIDAVIGDNGAKSVTFTDADGTVTTITLTGGGTATVTFAGDNLQQTQTSKGIVITGTNVTIDSVAVVNSGIKSKLTFKSKGGDTFVDIKDVTVTGAVDASLKEINAKTGRFTGEINVAQELTKLVAHTLDNAEVKVFSILEGQGLVPQGEGSFQFGMITAIVVLMADTLFWSPFGIKSFKTDSITSTNSSSIMADWIGALAVKGEANLDITLTGEDPPPGGIVLKSAKVGSITGHTWTGTGNVGAIAANDITGNFSFDFTGDVKSVKVKNNATGVFDARTIQTFDVKKDLTNAAITLSMPFDILDLKARTIKTFKVGGTADNVVLRSESSVGKLEVGRLLNSSLFAGLGNATAGVLPAQEDIINNAVIDSFKTKGIKDQNVAINNAVIVADTIVKADLANAGDNAGVNYGLAANNFTMGVKYKSANAKITLKPDQIIDPVTVLEEELVVNLLSANV